MSTQATIRRCSARCAPVVTPRIRANEAQPRRATLRGLTTFKATWSHATLSGGAHLWILRTSPTDGLLRCPYQTQLVRHAGFRVESSRNLPNLRSLGGKHTNCGSLVLYISPVTTSTVSPHTALSRRLCHHHNGSPKTRKLLILQTCHDSDSDFLLSG